MGLLDQVLGQVLGQFGGRQGNQGGFGQGGFNRDEPGPGGYNRQGGPGSGQAGGQGGLAGGLGGLLSGKGGPVALAILALLGSKHLKSGAGGYGSVLRDMFGGGRGHDGLSQGSLPGGGGMLGPNDGPRAGGSGSFMDEIGGLLGGSGNSGHRGDLGGMLGGGMLAGGLGSLAERFAQNGQGDVVQSWIGAGPNQPIAPEELDRSLGAGTIDELSRETGLGRDELLSQLSQALPQVVDRLTPEGRLPDEHEEARLV